MPLAAFALVVSRYKPTRLVVDDYAAYRQLREYLPREIFDMRIETLRLLVRREYPGLWPDTYMFMVAIALVIATAAFSIVARGLDISMWYPLLILIAPALLAYWTTRRRGMHYLRVSRFQDSLTTCLKEMTTQDIPRQVKWDFRRPRHTDTSEELHLRESIGQYAIALIIEAFQLDPEVDLVQQRGDILPSYVAASNDVLLALGPTAMDDIRLLHDQRSSDCEVAPPVASPLAAPPPAYCPPSGYPPEYHFQSPPQR
ncbi:hypothetical protein BCR43DRAFT_482264 [Syncephalastrum racemosum]|uniref:Uncharacterized protein n=1 Tax=Syncephalastrum racemosum TaxID=13706 RepID=A0A1X2HTG9_SYNRA|nr:hypothetical protein BCR43DRAFT_482264 [Syncephalastrum racemosum]